MLSVVRRIRRRCSQGRVGDSAIEDFAKQSPQGAERGEPLRQAFTEADTDGVRARERLILFG
jgi:hypothetical protein